MRKLIPDNKTAWNRVLSSPLTSWRSILSILVVGYALLIGHEVSAQKLPASSTSEVISSEAAISIIGPVDPLPFAPAVEEARFSCANTESSCVEAWARVVEQVLEARAAGSLGTITMPVFTHLDTNKIPYTKTRTVPTGYEVAFEPITEAAGIADRLDRPDLVLQWLMAFNDVTVEGKLGRLNPMVVSRLTELWRDAVISDRIDASEAYRFELQHRESDRRLKVEEREQRSTPLRWILLLSFITATVGMWWRLWYSSADPDGFQSDMLSSAEVLSWNAKDIPVQWRTSRVEPVVTLMRRSVQVALVLGLGTFVAAMLPYVWQLTDPADFAQTAIGWGLLFFCVVCFILVLTGLTRSGQVIVWREVVLSSGGIYIQTCGIGNRMKSTKLLWKDVSAAGIEHKRLGTSPAEYDIYQVVVTLSGHRQYVLGGKHDELKSKRLLLGVSTVWEASRSRYR